MLSKGDKILFISQYGGIIGGLEVYIKRAAELLRKNGFKTACIYVERTKNAEDFFAAFDEIYNVSEIDSLFSSDFALSTIHKISSPEILEKLVAKFSPTAFIHDHDYFCPKGYKYFPYKRINCTRGYNRLFCGICSSIVPPRHLKDGIAKMLRKNFQTSARLNFAIKKCPKFVVLSYFMKRELEANGIDSKTVKVIRPYLETENAYASEKLKGDVPRVVVAAQQVMSKGTPMLLEAMTKVKSNLVIHILGTGPRLEAYKDMAHEMGLDGKVYFEGFVPNTSAYFQRADFAAFPSLWQEPFGLSGIEAMGNALPVVGFNVGGVSEWLKKGVNGRLIKERDIDAFAAALDEYATNGEIRAHDGNTAKEFVAQNYTEERYLESFKELA